MADGIDCTCYAYGECECACGADWTPQKFYDVLRVAEQLQFWARRYACGRHTYAVNDVNDLTALLIALGGKPKPDQTQEDRDIGRVGTVWAEDGTFKDANQKYLEAYGRDGKGPGPLIQPKDEGCGYDD